MFQFAIRDSSFSFLPDSKEIAHNLTLKNQAVFLSYHSSPGVYDPVRENYDSGKAFQALMIDVGTENDRDT